MPPVRSVAILLHERDRTAERTNYQVWAMAETWRQMGIRVEVLRGLGREPDVDLLFPHIDLSYIPDDYWAFIQRHPNVVNRHLRDIRKTLYSRLRVTPGDGHEGPVIVKTVYNYGGRPDESFGSPRKTLPRRGLRFLARSHWVERRTLGFARALHRYHVYDRPARVPRAAFANPNLLVERFVPEPLGEGYVMRIHIVFGSRTRSVTLRGPDPFVKAKTAVLAPADPIPDEITGWCRQLRLDFAKLDYLMHDGRAYLLDVNPTPTLAGPVDPGAVARVRELAQGIEAFALPG